MATRRHRRRRKRPPTIWRCPDDLWNDIIQPIVDQYDPPAKTGRPRIDQRDALDGIIYQLRTDKADKAGIKRDKAGDKAGQPPISDLRISVLPRVRRSADASCTPMHARIRFPARERSSVRERLPVRTQRHDFVRRSRPPCSNSSSMQVHPSGARIVLVLVRIVRLLDSS